LEFQDNWVFHVGQDRIAQMVDLPTSNLR